MEVVDLTLPLFSGCPSFPGQPQVTVFPWHDISSHGHRTHVCFMADHTGTHVDLPAHFLLEGKTVEAMNLERFIGRALTFDVSSLTGRGVIRLSEFQTFLREEEMEGAIILLHTGMDVLFGKGEYFEKEVGISEEVARFLVEKKIKGVGIDAPSIDPYPFEVHRILLAHEILIFESLTNLKALVERTATFFGVPLKLTGCSGSPIRAFALRE